jgi:hypothetical protein
VYYASNTGDSYILQIENEKQAADTSDNVNPNFNPDTNQLDRPYLRVIEEHQSLAPIVDLQLRDKFIIKNEDSRKSQNELLVVSGSNYTSHINIIRKGISIKDHISIEDLPAIQS